MVRDLTKGNPTKLIVMFAISMLASSLMSYVYSTTDSLMVSWYIDPDALGAISAAAPATDMIQGFAASVISGFSLLAGRIFGSGDIKRLRNMMANVVYLSAILVGVATLICTVFCRTFVNLMNTPAGFVDMATSYLFIILLAMPISAISWVCAGMFRALGDSKTPLLISAICGLLNVVFNAFFLGLLRTGIEGAAYGTVCATAVGSVMYLVFLKKRMSILLFGKEDAGISWPTVKTLLSNGIPLGVLNSVVSIGATILQIAVNGHGEDVVTGVSTGGRVLTIFWIFFQVFESSIIYFCAQNLGAGRVDRVRTGVRNTMFICWGLGAVCTAFALLFGKYIFMMFVGDNPEIISVAEQYLFTQIIFFPLMVTLCTWRGGLKGLGNTVPAVMCGIIELIARLVVSFFFADHLMVLFFAGPAAWIGASIFLAIQYPRTLKKMELAQQNQLTVEPGEQTLKPEETAAGN
ncbi:MAG: polysaccharide biosynthesis C-terminal domain-containing protein [Clostridia bacterium]|nr:polysaccharide biosynthesis C-terminal domain-containing protein [Clostridia bacterium]